MKITGEATLHAPLEKVWDALLDPAVLVATIPGCERLETVGENTYATTINAGVAAVKGTYSGTCELRDLDPHSSLVLHAQAAGAPGTIATDVKVTFSPGDDGTTAVSYDADATVGGMIAGVGQRMLTSVSRRMAEEFFGNVDQVLSGKAPAAAVQAPAAAVGAPAATAEAPAAAVGRVAGADEGGAGVSRPGQVFTAPARPSAVGDDFAKGVAVGAGLVLLGVVAGAVASRRKG